MANDKRVANGWKPYEPDTQPIVSEPIAISPAKGEGKPVTGTPKLTWNGICEALDTVSPSRRWTFDGLDKDQRQKLLEILIGEDVALSIESVKTLREMLQTTPGPHGGTLGGHFSVVVELAEDWLRQRNALAPESDEGTKYRNAFFADLNARGGDFKVGESQ